MKTLRRGVGHLEAVAQGDRSQPGGVQGDGFPCRRRVGGGDDLVVDMTAEVAAAAAVCFHRFLVLLRTKGQAGLLWFHVVLCTDVPANAFYVLPALLLGWSSFLLGG